MKKIVIVGGAGYVGSMLVPRLLERGYTVKGFHLLWFGNNLPAGVEVQQRDAMQICEDDLKDIDTVIFIAGLSNDPMVDYSPSENFIQNAACPAYPAYTAKRASVRRFIHGGSCSVYGYTVNQLYDEQSPSVSNNPYCISKLQGEFAGIQQADDKFSVIALRQGTISGYSPRMRLDLVVNTMFKGAVQDGIIRIDNPAIWRPILAIQDAIDGYVRALEAAPEISGIFNVASGNYTIGEVGDYVAEGVKEYLGLSPRIMVNNVQDFRNYKVSWEKAQNVLGFHPRLSIKDIVKDLAENLEKFKNFNDEIYYNIRTFKTLSARTSEGPTR